MCKVKVEQLISRLETYEAEHCVSISIDLKKDRRCLEIWDPTNGCPIDYIPLPES